MPRQFIIYTFLLLLGAGLLLGGSSWSTPSAAVADEQKLVTISSPDRLSLKKGEYIDDGSITASAFVVVDEESGEEIVAFNADESLPIASVTKLFTAAAVYDHYQNEVATITAGDLASEGPFGKLSLGETYTLYQLLFPLLIESSNDAAAAMERVTNGEVIEQMNQLTSDLGYESTSFADASGLSSADVSTARDLASLTIKLAKDYPHLFDITTLGSYKGTSTVLLNNNPFIKDKDYQGGKHGYTEAALHTAVARFTEGERNVVYVVLGSEELAADIAALRQIVADSD